MAAPIDLNILVDSSAASTEKKILTAFKLGYSAVAINFVVENLNLTYGKGSYKGIPKAESLKVSEAKIQALGIRRKVKQYTRISITMTEATPYSRLQGDDIKAFDILALRPTTDKLLQLACTSLDVDIISLDFSEKLPFYLLRKSIKKARLRGAFFEVSYSPLIRDRTLRKRVISSALELKMQGGSRCTVITSACENAMELRAPKDVMNLGMLFGLKETEAKDAITANARAVIVRAESRNTSRRVLKMQKIPSPSADTPASLTYLAEEDDDEDMEKVDESDEEDVATVSRKRPLEKEPINKKTAKNGHANKRNKVELAGSISMK